MGRFDESRAQMEHARQLDPLSLIITADTAIALYYARDYPAAIQQFRAVIDLELRFHAPLSFLLRICKRAGTRIPWPGPKN